MCGFSTKNSKHFSIAKEYIHRYIRLVPRKLLEWKRNPKKEKQQVKLNYRQTKNDD